MSFNGTEGAPIALEKAAEWTANYRNNAPSDAIKAHFIGKDGLNAILTQDGCMGVRIYYAIDDKGKQQLILVGANAAENDMTELVYDETNPCPNRCDTNGSPLLY